MCKLSWSISGLLFVALVVMVFKFIILGSVVPASDGRKALLLEAGERDMVLSEMRIFLASVQAITDGISSNDMSKVATAAQAVGGAAQKGMPASLVGKLPLTFKKLGFDTHRKFDMLALDAKQLGDPAHSLKQLAALMNNCVRCHARYRIETLKVAK